ncbi:MAG: restriction endonuclease [Pontixanthobacter sp.]
MIATNQQCNRSMFMGKVWGVHMPEWVGDDPIECKYVCLGWNKVGNIFEMPADREAYKLAIQAAYPEKKPGAVPVDAGTLFRFAHEVKEGDLIVYPSKHNRMVNIGYATGQKWHEPKDAEDERNKPNFIGVEWQGQFPRSDFSQAALNEIGSFITLFRIRSHASQFRAKVEADQIQSSSQTIDEEAIPDDLATQNASQLAEESTQDFVARRIMAGLNGYEFEHFVAHLMECMGYTTRVSEKSGDGGVDVIAHMDELGFQPPIIKIQCKRQTGSIGEPEVHQLLGTLGEGEFALFVTLGSYTRQARIRERSAPRLRLIDGEEFVDLIQTHYGQLSPRYRTMIPLRQIYVPDLISE